MIQYFNNLYLNYQMEKKIIEEITQKITEHLLSTDYESEDEITIKDNTLTFKYWTEKERMDSITLYKDVAIIEFRVYPTYWRVSVEFLFNRLRLAKFYRYVERELRNKKRCEIFSKVSTALSETKKEN